MARDSIEDRIFAYIQKNEPVTFREIAREFGLTSSGSADILKILQENGLVAIKEKPTLKLVTVRRHEN